MIVDYADRGATGMPMALPSACMPLRPGDLLPAADPGGGRWQLQRGGGRRDPACST